jgi:alkyl sulfatase BDS1-like metallo-beta-lactamase superfamily hydrolase
VTGLAGGVAAVVERARVLAASGEFRLACHLIETAVTAAPDDKRAHGARAEIYTARRKGETSLMAHGIFGAAARESEKKA